MIPPDLYVVPSEDGCYPKLMSKNHKTSGCLKCLPVYRHNVDSRFRRVAHLRLRSGAACVRESVSEATV